MNMNHVINKIKKLFTISLFGILFGILCVSIFVVGLFMDHNIAYADTITNLTNYTWTGNSNIYGGEFPQRQLDFSCNGVSYSSIKVNSTGLYYGSTLVFDNDDEVWLNNNYKVINITGGADATNSSLISWFQSKGTLVSNFNPDYQDGYDHGYSDGLVDGYQDGYNVGYLGGQQDGYNTGYYTGQQVGYQEGLSNGYQDGYDKGYSDGYSYYPIVNNPFDYSIPCLTASWVNQSDILGINYAVNLSSAYVYSINAQSHPLFAWLYIPFDCVVGSNCYVLNDGFIQIWNSSNSSSDDGFLDTVEYGFVGVGTDISDTSIDGRFKYNDVILCPRESTGIVLSIPLINTFDNNLYYCLVNFYNTGSFKVNGSTASSSEVYDKIRIDSYNEGSRNGFNIGYEKALEDMSSDSFGWYNLFGAIYDVPIKTFDGLFNLTILGVNLKGFLLGLISLCVVLFILKIVFK